MFTTVLLVIALVFLPVIELQEVVVADNFVIVESVAGVGLHGSQDGELAEFNLPSDIFSSGDGSLFVIDTHNNLIRLINEDGYVSRVTGNVLDLDQFSFPQGAYRDGAIESSLFNRPMGGVLDSQGWIFIADSANHTIRVIIDDNVFTFAGSNESGHVDGSFAEARFYQPSSIAIGSCGNFFVTDSLNHVIRKIDLDGNVTTIAGIPGVYGHQDGTAETAIFNTPMGIAVSEDGVIYVADTENHLIRVIEDGYVRTLAGTVVFPDDLNLGETYDFNEEPMGGFADGEEAMFNLPVGLTLWNDILIVADSANHRIRAVLPNGETITLAGTGYPGHIDGFYDIAEFHFPRGVYVNEDKLFIADTGNNIIRVLFLI